jgi:DNA-directed RNA polymerase subunit M/transcription elongation factor TFIIS
MKHCKYCPALFSSSKSLWEHEDRHIHAWECRTCRQQFASRTSMYKHRKDRSHHDFDKVIKTNGLKNRKQRTSPSPKRVRCTDDAERSSPCRELHLSGEEEGEIRGHTSLTPPPSHYRTPSLPPTPVFSIMVERGCQTDIVLKPEDSVQIILWPSQKH